LRLQRLTERLPIKIRLMSPLSKSVEVQNDRNIAIGKAKSLGRTLRWLNPDAFPAQWVEMVRQRFYCRMKDYLPKEGTSLYFQTLLPEALGGLDMGFNGEIQRIFSNVPKPTRQLMAKLLMGEAEPKLVRIFKAFTSNGVERATKLDSSWINAIESSLIKDLEPLDPYQLRDSLGLSADLPLRKLLKKLRNKGFMTPDDLVRECSRGFVFNDVLSENRSISAYNTTPWKKRYASLWDATFDPGYSVDDLPELYERVKELDNINRFIPLRVYNADVEVKDFRYRPLTQGLTMSGDRSGPYLSKTGGGTPRKWREYISDGLPDLRLNIS